MQTNDLLLFINTLMQSNHASEIFESFIWYKFYFFYNCETMKNTSALLFKGAGKTQWTVPQLSIMIIYNSAWSILFQWIRDILSGDNLT